MRTEGNTASTVSDSGSDTSSKTNQIFRAILVIGILAITPFIVWQFMIPITFAHPLGIVVVTLLLVMIGFGLYIIAEGKLPNRIGK
ncbi:hypothetical protein [Halostagnicola bangensis]